MSTASASALPVALETQAFSATVAPFGSAGFSTAPLALSQFNPAPGTLMGVGFRVELAAYDLTLNLDGYDPSSGVAFVRATLYGGQCSVSKSLPCGGGNRLATVSGFGDTIANEGDLLNFSSSVPWW